ncbi:MAG: hypothetical protein Kow0056_06300 [Coriobacteriia bacterium]
MILVDTNVFVYALDSGDETKHEKAVELLQRLGPHHVCVSTQVLSELAHVMTHPDKLAMPVGDAMETLQALATSCVVLPVGYREVMAALHARAEWQLQHYDAQLWAVASLNGIRTVLSEDFSAGAVLGGVEFMDPFDEDLDIEALVARGACLDDSTEDNLVRELRRARAVEAAIALQRASGETGKDELSDEEIAAEIAEARRDDRGRSG